MSRPRDALAEGTELAGYIIGRVLGRGGFGMTYAATDALYPDAKVAIKEFLPAGLGVRESGDATVHPASNDLAEDYARMLRRFEDEARTLVALRHANIVEAQRFIKANGTAYVVMKYEDGTSLGGRLAGDKTLSEGELRRILPPLLDGLEAVHARAFIHRDIKPDNIYLRSADGSPVLLDFGAARQASAEERKASLTEIVTPGYAPYEQYDRYSAQGTYTDVYALGATLYRCVTGKRPIDAPARVTAAARRLPDPLPPARDSAKGGYSPALLDAIDKALAVFENDRPQTVADFRRLLAFEAAPPVARVAPGLGGVPASTETVVLGEAAASVVAETRPPVASALSSEGANQPLSPETGGKLAARPRNRDDGFAGAKRRRSLQILAAGFCVVALAAGLYAWLENGTGAGPAASGEKPSAEPQQAEADWKQCGDDAVAADARIAACTHVITRGARSTADLAAAYAHRASAQNKTKQYQRAIEDSDRAIELESRLAVAFRERAFARFHLKQYRRAIQDLDRAIELDPRHSDAYNSRGVAHFELKEYVRAVENFDKAIELDPQHARAYFHRGSARAELGQYQSAIKDYDRAIEIDSSLTDAFVGRGTAYLYLNQYRRAIRDFDRALELDPSSGTTYYNRGAAYEKLGNRNAAIRDYREALRLGASDAAVRLRRLGAASE